MTSAPWSRNANIDLIQTLILVVLITSINDVCVCVNIYRGTVPWVQ